MSESCTLTNTPRDLNCLILNSIYQIWDKLSVLYNVLVYIEAYFYTTSNIAQSSGPVEYTDCTSVEG